jgi:hypothetical protein
MGASFILTRDPLLWADPEKFLHPDLMTEWQHRTKAFRGRVIIVLNAAASQACCCPSEPFRFIVCRKCPITANSRSAAEIVRLPDRPDNCKIGNGIPLKNQLKAGTQKKNYFMNNYSGSRLAAKLGNRPRPFEKRSFRN